VGGELRQQGFIAIASTLVLILVYVAFRFDLAFAPGAVLALFHDVTIVVGVFVLTQREFNLPMIGALLTIIGYSLNDTIVIYDRIRENMTRYRRRDMHQLINDSINETMSRTLATSLTTALGMAAFLVLGGPVIETFALAILMGVVVGTYSTVFVASPTILVMQDFRPHLEKIFSPLSADEEEAEEGEDGEGKPMTATELRRRARQGEP
jgi:preprotein translocase subunit SecF